jgi:ElaB/YqjD/DUF883 family membrane-anchored ribosome-binding protein
VDEDARSAGSPVGAEAAGRDRTPEDIRADIERTRREVGDTAEALAAKTDVKARASERIDEIKSNVREKAEQIKPSGGGGGESATDAGGQLVAKVRANPAPAALGSAALFGFLIGRLTGRRAP